MSSRFLFQPQNNLSQILDSLLIVLSLTSPLESKHVKTILHGFVCEERFYLNSQRRRGWLKKLNNGLLTLTPKAARRVQSNYIQLVANFKHKIGQIEHEVMLLRSLFLCLMHLNLSHVKEVKKQKRNGTEYIHDLTITTPTDVLSIEVDLGSKPVESVEAKIQGFQARLHQRGTLIYFTTSAKIYFYFSAKPDIQFIYLRSPNVCQDMQRVISKNQLGHLTNPTKSLFSKATREKSAITERLTYPTNPYLNEPECDQDVNNEQGLPYYNKQDNSFNPNDYLSPNNDTKRQELIKMLYSDN